MTRKDYELIADAIRTARERYAYPPEGKAIEILISELALALNAENQLFDAYRFIKACRPE